MVDTTITPSGHHIAMVVPYADNETPLPLTTPDSLEKLVTDLSALLGRYAPADAAPARVQVPGKLAGIALHGIQDGSLTYSTPYSTDTGQGPQSVTIYLDMCAALGLHALLCDLLG